MQDCFKYPLTSNIEDNEDDDDVLCLTVQSKPFAPIDLWKEF
jgi:hypothetical protein